MATRSTYDVESCLRDVKNIRTHYGIDRWIIGGHSWSADLALLYALEHRDHTAGLLCIAGGRVHNDREWHALYEQRKAEQGEYVPPFAYPPNREVNEQLNQCWKRYIQRPTLLKQIAHQHAPALFVYGERDIRPSWRVEQVAHLMPHAQFVRIAGVEHVIWAAHADELEMLLRDFVRSCTASQSVQSQR